MTVSTIASLAAGVSSAIGRSDPRLASSIQRLFSNNNTGNTGTNQTDPLLVTTSVGSQVAALRIAARNVAQASTQVSIAQRGADQIAQNVNQLQRLATQAADPALDDNARAQLDNQFQQIRQQITTVVNRTSFSGQTLLDGQQGGLTTDGSGFNGLSDQNIFGRAALSLRSADAAQAAVTVLTRAQQYVATQQTALANVAQGIDVASATVQSALQNEDAARSSISDEDFTNALFSGSIINPRPDLLATYSEQSLRAQSNRLPPSLVTLLGE